MQVQVMQSPYHTVKLRSTDGEIHIVNVSHICSISSTGRAKSPTCVLRMIGGHALPIAGTAEEVDEEIFKSLQTPPLVIEPLEGKGKKAK